jgi:hypothetical protein
MKNYEKTFGYLNTEKSNPETQDLHFRKKEEVFNSGPGVRSGVYLKA